MHKARYSALLTIALVGGSVLPGTAAAIDRHPTVDQPPGVSTSTLTPEQAARARPMLREGVRGPAVVYVQQRLEVTPRSGYFGPLTRAAVQAFQRQNDLRATGRVTENVWVALLGQSPDVAAEARPRLEQGMRGPAVVYVSRNWTSLPPAATSGP